MARRDVLHYYNEIQDSYLEVVSTLQELDIEYKKGNISQEQYDTLLERLESDVTSTKETYELLSYVIFLLNIPNRPKKAKKYEVQNKIYFEYLKKYSSEELLNDSDIGVKKIKQIIDETLKKEK